MRAAIGNPLDQSLFFEFEQRQPNVAAMGLKQLAKVQLDQPLPRLASAKDDVLLDALGDDKAPPVRAPALPQSPKTSGRALARLAALPTIIVPV